MKYSVPKGINREAHIGWCPGCGHGIIVRLVAEAPSDILSAKTFLQRLSA